MESLITKVIDSRNEQELYHRCLQDVYSRYHPQHCLIAEYDLEQKLAHTHCYLHNGDLADNITYSLGGTPCELVLDNREICIYQDNIQQQFPDDIILQVINAKSYLGIPIQSRSGKVIGVIALMYDTELPDIQFDNTWLETLGFLIGKTILQQRLANQKDRLLAQFERSEQLTQSGSWTWDISQNHFSYSKNLAKMVGITENQQLHFADFFRAYIFKSKISLDRFVSDVSSGDEAKTVTVYREMCAINKQFEISYIKKFTPSGELRKVVGNIRNTTDISQLEADFTIAQKVVDLSSNGVLITDKHNRIISTNSKVEDITGYSFAELEGQSPSILSSSLHPASFYQKMWAELHEQGHWSGEVWNQTKFGAVYPEKLTIYVLRNRVGEIQNYIATFEDLSEIKSIESELNNYKNEHDFTGLQTRENFIKALQETDNQTVLILDIKRFSSINNMYGESFGNKVLVHVGHTLATNFDTKQINICRYGPDQFALSFSQDSLEGVNKFVSFVRSQIETAVTIDDHEIDLLVNIGCSNMSEFDSKTHPIKQAYYALRQAKSDPTPSTSIYSSQLEKRVARQYALGARLKKAIDEKRIDVFYQPILDLNSEKVVKLEALARWTEDGEMISPFEFIPIAEKLGYIFQLGEIILEKSCQDLKKLKALGHDNIAISINRSIDELSEEDQANCSILNIIRNSGLSEKDIIIEVTESIPLEDKPHVQELLRVLRSKGVKVALDDFGTGYASFSNLMKNSIDILKIDRSFVKDISTNQNNAVLIKSVNLLADQLGLDVIAEGVEDYQQLNLLQELGCRYIQGYLISKPQPFDDIVLEVERINKT